MEYTEFDDTYVVRLDRGEEIISSLKEFCQKEKISLASVDGLGATDHLEICLYDVVNKVFHRHTFEEPMEITSLHGNISTMCGETYLHIHINAADSELNVHGGHLSACRISATGELFIRKIEGRVERRKDEVTGLNLYYFNQEEL